MNLEILTYPDPRLRQVAVPVKEVTPEIQAIATKMLEVMYKAEGVGLASIQVNILHRMLVADCSRTASAPLILINPEITHQDGLFMQEEGCLSFPGVSAKVERASTITCSYIDEHGKPQTLTTDGLLAKCIQHEIDHLNGKLFIDYLSPLKQSLLKRKLEKYQRLKDQHKVF